MGVRHCWKSNQILTKDIEECYANGASSYISKPALFEDLVGIVRNLTNYWLDVVELPV